MYVTTPKRKNGSTVVRLVVCFREGGKVKNRIVKTIGQSKDKLIIKEYVKVAYRLIEEEKKGLINVSDLSKKMPVDLYGFSGKDRVNNGFDDILGLVYDQLEFNHLIQANRSSRNLNNNLRNLVLMRVFQPESKLKSCDLLYEHFKEKLSHKQVLTVMDHLSNSEFEIKGRLFQSMVKAGGELDLILYDVTTLYFESVSQTDLKDFGYSKDGKFNEVQVVLAVLSNKDGLPVDYELFRGNTGETKTLRKVLENRVRKLGVKQIRFVADRGMFSEENFKFFDDWNEDKPGTTAEYVVGCPLRKMPKFIKQEILDLSRYKKISEGVSYFRFNHKGRYITVFHAEESRKKDEKKRQKNLDKLYDMADNGEIPAEKMIKKKGFLKFTQKVKGKIKIDLDKIEEDKKWDGLFGVCSNNKDSPAEELIQTYRSLWKIEELFRINKHTLKMRPIYHWISKRIRAHIMICFLAYTVLKWAQINLKKANLSFSPQGLVDALKRSESFVLHNRTKPGGPIYCVPRDLPTKTQQIYTAFNKKRPIGIYKM